MIEKFSLFFNLVSVSEILLSDVGNNQKKKKKGGLTIYLRDEFLGG